MPAAPAVLSLVADARRALVTQIALTTGPEDLRKRVSRLLAGELEEADAEQARGDLDLIAVRLFGRG